MSLEAILLESKATAVVAELSKAEEFKALESDKPFLDFVMELIKQLVPLLMQCFVTVSAAKKELTAPKLLTRVRLKLHVRRALRDDEGVDLMGRPLVEAILKVAKEVTSQELTQLSDATATV